VKIRFKKEKYLTRISNVRQTTKFKRSIKAISPVIATLLMIAIAVVASLVVYAWVTGYIGGATDKAGNAIQIQSFAPKVDPADDKSKLVVYVQNVGQGVVQLKPGTSLYVNGDLVPIIADGPITIAEGQTVELLTDYEYSGEKLGLKVTTTGGTFTQTVGQSAPGHTSTAQLVKYSVDFILGAGGKTINPIVTQAIAKGATVPISTTPDDGYTFDKWTSTGSITIENVNSESTTATVNGAGSITATFTATDYIITVTKNPTIGGTVNRDILEPYHYNNIVTLTANPADGYTFNGWSGAGVGSGIDRQVTVTGNMEVTANFAASPYEINVIIEPTAAGGANRDKSPPYAINNIVTLTPAPNTGYTFSAWSGDGVNGAGNTRIVTVTRDMTVTATYTANPATLALTRNPIEGGTIIQTPNRAYTYGETVALEAKPSTGYSFTGWTENLNEATNPTSITLDANIHSVTANFAKNQVGLTLVYDPTDGGTIIAEPSQTIYYYGDTVKLTANPSSTYSFSSWTSGLTGTTNPQSITLTADSTTVTAKFNSAPSTWTLTINKLGTGTVYVDGVKYTAPVAVPKGNTVSLSETPGTDKVFGGWYLGTTSDFTSSFSVVMDGDKTVKAVFGTREIIFEDNFDKASWPTPQWTDGFSGYYTRNYDLGNNHKHIGVVGRTSHQSDNKYDERGSGTIAASVVTTGIYYIQANYDVYAQNLESNGHFNIAWSIGTGSWTPIQDYRTNSWATQQQTLLGAQDSTSIHIRFNLVNDNTGQNYGYVDNLSITGITPS
jgi:uncharacterized repeat protein (TIGR02543 family)/flagellin-like protein